MTSIDSSKSGEIFRMSNVKNCRTESDIMRTIRVPIRNGGQRVSLPDEFYDDLDWWKRAINHNLLCPFTPNIWSHSPTG